MCTIFKSHKLWDMVEQGFENHVKKEDGGVLSAAQKLAFEENVPKDAKALGLIQSAISDEIFPRIALQESAKAAWEILQKEFGGDKKFYGEDISDQRIVQKLLISLSREYDSIAEVIEETKDTETIRVQEVIGYLKSHEQRLQRHTEKLTVKAFSSLSVNPREHSNAAQDGSSKSKKNWKS
ncbi:unnamed protein product [Prunus armeniaca]